MTVPENHAATWRDLADQLTAEQIGDLEKSEAASAWDSLNDAAELLLHIARRCAQDNLADAMFAEVPLPDGADHAESWEQRPDGTWLRCLGRPSHEIPGNKAAVTAYGTQHSDGTVTWLLGVIDGDDLTPPRPATWPPRCSTPPTRSTGRKGRHAPLFRRFASRKPPACYSNFPRAPRNRISLSHRCLLHAKSRAYDDFSRIHPVCLPHNAFPFIFATYDPIRFHFAAGGAHRATTIHRQRRQCCRARRGRPMTGDGDASCWRDLTDQLTGWQINELDRMDAEADQSAMPAGDQAHALLEAARGWARANLADHVLFSDVTPPADATRIWLPEESDTGWIRAFDGTRRSVSADTDVIILGCQNQDGTTVRTIGIVARGDYDAATARQIAAAILDAADELDRAA
ncbi:hypothetical protein [Mycobacterium kiyosense]